MEFVYQVARVSPLFSAIAAPVATLMEIPALTEHWYALNGVVQPDVKASVILSGFGLALNIIANILLMLRFTLKTPRRWRLATTLSLCFWLGKTVVAIINLIVFGVLIRNGVGYSYLQGFWCAVIGVVLAGIISIALLWHYMFAYKKQGTCDATEVRIEGRRFQQSVAILMFILGVQALVYSQTESWLYSDGIYFSIVTVLTIGFGDLVPKTAVTKGLIFPFAILTISQLGNQISMVIGYFESRARERRSRWREHYERIMHDEEQSNLSPKGLAEEIALINKVAQRELLMGQLIDLAWSALCLTVFWGIGAAAFSQMESWSYGNALYFNVVFSATIGYGDFAPKTAAGRMVFIVYAIMAVPVVASFAVQSISGLLSTFSSRHAARDRLSRNQDVRPDSIIAHHQFVLQHHESYKEVRRRRMTSGGGNSSSSENIASSDAQRQTELELLHSVVQLALRLEAQARALLVDLMDRDSLSRAVFMADRNVQRRDVKAMGGEDNGVLTLWNEEETRIKEDAAQENALIKRVQRYRDTFAEFIVVSSILQKLEGKEQYQFERRRDDVIGSNGVASPNGHINVCRDSSVVGIIA